MKRKQLIFGSTMTTLVIVGIVVGMLVSQSLLAPIMPDRFWRPVQAADGNPGAGASGLLEIFIYPHQANPAATYAANLSSASAYAARNTWNGTLTGDVPYAPTTFDIVIKVRFNATHAYNASAPGWDMTYVKALITCAALSIGADTEMEEVEIAHADAYIWVNFWMDNSNNGYTVSHGATTNVTSVKLQAYF
jgi:hypothetical protein